MMTASQAVRIGVLGCADVAQRRTLPSLRDVPGLTLTAMASRSPERAREFAERFGGVPLDSYEALLESDDVDAVYVPLPPALHEEWVGKALRAGKHVLVEKPFATDAEQASRMLALAAECGRVLMENLMFLHHGQHERVCQMVAHGAIGEPRHFEGVFGFPPLCGDDYRYDPVLGGGALLDAGIYPLRAATLQLGQELEPEGAVLVRDPQSGVDVSGHALLHTPSGHIAQVSFGFEFAYRCVYSLWGSEGRIVLDRAYTPPWWHQPTIRIERDDRVEEIRLPAQDQFASSLRAFAGAVLGSARPHDEPEDVLRQARLIERIRNCASEIIR